MSNNPMAGDGIYIQGQPHSGGHHPFMHVDVYETTNGQTQALHAPVTADAQGLGLFALGAYDAAMTRERRGR